MGRRALVLGSNGFLGAHLCRALAGDGWAVTAFDRYSRPPNDLLLHPDVSIAQGDIQNDSDVGPAVQGVDTVFHFLSASNPVVTESDPLYDLRVNVEPSVRLLQHCAANDVSHFYFASSGGTVYGDQDAPLMSERLRLEPTNPYGIGKAAVEHYMRYFASTADLVTTSLRIGNPYGTDQRLKRGQGLIPKLIECFRSGSPFTVQGDGSMTRDYIHVDDLMSLILTLVSDGPSHAEYNLGTGKGHSVMDVIGLLEEISGQQLELSTVPRPTTALTSAVMDMSRFTSVHGLVACRSLDTGLREVWAAS